MHGMQKIILISQLIFISTVNNSERFWFDYFRDKQREKKLIWKFKWEHLRHSLLSEVEQAQAALIADGDVIDRPTEIFQISWMKHREKYSNNFKALNLSWLTNWVKNFFRYQTIVKSRRERAENERPRDGKSTAVES